MDNAGFLRAIEKSFEEFIRTGTSRSTAKLVPLHGAIARDFHERLGDDYVIESQGYGGGSEGTIQGRYMDKKVDITISRDGKAVGGIAVKFVMQNYAQNSNNYFENMLGETANIRSSRCPYFQLLAIPDVLPYYDKNKNVKHWETITDNNLHKYCVLDGDDVGQFFHSPNKTLIYVIRLPDVGDVHTRDEYREAYKRIISQRPDGGYVTTANVINLNNTVIVNDYETFADKVYHHIKSL